MWLKITWIIICEGFTLTTYCVHAKSFQSCPTLCNPMDCSPPEYVRFTELYTLRTGVNDTSNKDILLVYFYKVSLKNVIT